MKNFIKLTLQDNLYVFVNISLIFDIYKNTNIEKSNTTISFGNDYTLLVIETPDEIMDLISKLSK